MKRADERDIWNFLVEVEEKCPHPEEMFIRRVKTRIITDPKKMNAPISLEALVEELANQFHSKDENRYHFAKAIHHLLQRRSISMEQIFELLKLQLQQPQTKTA